MGRLSHASAPAPRAAQPAAPALAPARPFAAAPGVIQCVKEKKPAPLPLLRASQTPRAQFLARMAQVRGMRQRREPMADRDRNQLIAHESNANFLSTNVNAAMAGSQARRAANPRGQESARLDRALEPMRALTQPGNAGALFTRDIDSGELVGLTHSRRMLSVNERQLDGIGRLRKMGDLNRGGGAGSYTRVISGARVDAAREASADPAGYDPQRDPNLAQLGVGSIGNAGITLALDAAGAAADVRHPLELFHNNQDSAGRLFGRELANGRRVGRGSERILGRMNPSYYKRTAASPPVRPFNENRAVAAAVAGQAQLRDIVEHPSAATDHNEQIWMKPPSLAHVKTVFIQKQLDRPPRLDDKTPEELARDRQKRARAVQAVQTRKEGVRQQFRQGQIAHPEMVRHLAPLMSRERELAKPLPRQKVVDQSARLPRELRLPAYWQGGRAPRGYEALENLRGAGGKSFAELVLHVPPSLKRAMLPQVADENLRRAIRDGARPARPPQLYPPAR
ncbi:MAG TPA: hypothetical protein VFT45_18860 [Longimicrobium sp.]|nr:hypothetical protein [Longimicrobium sp.]